jgi:hypothetical protein
MWVLYQKYTLTLRMLPGVTDVSALSTVHKLTLIDMFEADNSLYGYLYRIWRARNDL